MKIYELRKAEKNAKGIIFHNVSQFGEDKVFRYRSIRVGLNFPTGGVPAYLLACGEEVEDELESSPRPLIRAIEDVELESLSPDALFDKATDLYSLYLCDTLYLDGRRENFKQGLWTYLDSRNLSKVRVFDAPFIEDTSYRYGLVDSWNTSGDLSIPKDWPLFQEMKSVSRADLSNHPEEKFFRLNCLSYVISGFEKYSSAPPLIVKVGPMGRPSWMR